MSVSVESGARLEEAANSLLGTLNNYLPDPAPDLPVPTVSFASLAERGAGIGRSRGSDSAGPFSAVALKAIRLEALVRFQVWAGDPGQADQIAGDLNASLMRDRESLRAAGFLRFALENAPPAELVPDPFGVWRRHAEYRVLYEFDYQDDDDAQGIIAQIPVSIDSGLGESMTITAGMTRWDNASAPLLSVRGPETIGGVSLLAFVPGQPPTGAVKITRTYDGAPDPPTTFGTLRQFLAAVSGETPNNRNATVTFPNYARFRAAFQSAGDPIEIGDFDNDGVADRYKPLSLVIDPAIRLPKVIDRFEIAYGSNQFDKVAVVYVRATH